MSETDVATSTIEQTIRIEARPETVWEFWTDPARLCEWWGIEAETVLQTGGLFRVVMESGPVMRGEFLELERPRHLKFTFGWEDGAPAGPMGPGSTEVDITLDPADDRDGGATMLTLRHRLPASHADDHARGWAHYVGDQMVALARRGSS